MAVCLVKGNSVIGRVKKVPAPGLGVLTTYLEGKSADPTKAKVGFLRKASLETELATARQKKPILKPPRIFFFLDREI